MGAFTYGGRFEQMMSELCNRQNVASTAKRFQDLEQRHGAYAFGSFLRHFLPRPEEYANWEGDSGNIPGPIRQRLTEIIASNLRSASPLPMVLKVGENVDATHDLDVKIFSHDGQVHIGILMLCPNTQLR